MTKKSPKKGKTFLQLLKKQCQKCTAGTVKTYLQNIRRLYRLEFEGDVPLTGGKWLDSDKLFAKYKKTDLTFSVSNRFVNNTQNKINYF